LKIAEALILRADTQKKVLQINDRLSKNALVQDGDAPSEKPEDLIKELKNVLNELLSLIKSINKTNSHIEFEKGKTLTDALAERDVLLLEIKSTQNLLEASKVIVNRYSQSEIKYKSTINISDTQKKLDKLSKTYRDLDTKIQELNWKFDLI
jgi:hypothetical protein